jgi:hypothetical protein
VGVLQRLGELGDDPGGPGEGDRLAGHPLGQALALDQGHRDVGAIGLAAGLIDGHDPRVAEPREDPRLGQEPVDAPATRRDALARQLEGDLAPQERIEGTIDRRVVALAQDPDQLEPAEPLAGRLAGVLLRAVAVAVQLVVVVVAAERAERADVDLAALLQVMTDGSPGVP